MFDELIAILQDPASAFEKEIALLEDRIEAQEKRYQTYVAKTDKRRKDLEEAQQQTGFWARQNAKSIMRLLKLEEHGLDREDEKLDRLMEIRGQFLSRFIPQQMQFYELDQAIRTLQSELWVAFVNGARAAQIKSPSEVLLGLESKIEQAKYLLLKSYNLSIEVQGLQAQRRKLLPSFLRKLEESGDKYQLTTELRKRQRDLEEANKNVDKDASSIDASQFIVTFLEERKFLEDIIFDLKAALEKKDRRAYIGTLPTEEVRDLKEKDDLIKKMIDVTAPKGKRSVEEEVFDHVQTVISQLETAVSLKEAGEQLKQKYPKEFHWFVDMTIRKAIDGLKDR